MEKNYFPVEVNFWQQQFDESKKRCAPIDARIDEFEKEFFDMVAEYKRLENLPIPKGFFNRLKAKWVLSDLDKRIDKNRDMRMFLYEKRIKNTLYKCG